MFSFVFKKILIKLFLNLNRVICSLQSIENADREVLGQYVSLFKQNSSDELVKHPLSFSSIAYDAAIFNFPNYFANVYDWIYLTLVFRCNDNLNTCYFIFKTYSFILKSFIFKN